MNVSEFLRFARGCKAFCQSRHLNPYKVEVGFQIQRPRELQWQSLEDKDLTIIDLHAKNEKDEELTLPGGGFIGLSIAVVECNADSGLYSEDEMKEVNEGVKNG